MNVRLHLFKLFSDQEPNEKGRYAPIPHPEAAQAVIEVASFVVPCRAYDLQTALAAPASGDEDSAWPGRIESPIVYELKSGYDGTLLVRVAHRPIGGRYSDDMPVALWPVECSAFCNTPSLIETGNGARKMKVNVPPFEYHIVYAGSEHLVAVSLFQLESYMDPSEIRFHVWSF